MASIVADDVKWSLEYLFASHEEDRIKKKKAELRTNLYNHIKENGEEDEDGNIIFYFDEPRTVDGDTWFKGLMLQKRTSEYVDDDIAMQIIVNNGLEDECLQQVTTTEVDYDALYACNQKGLVTDEEIDSLLSTDETWALVKMKAY